VRPCGDGVVAFSTDTAPLVDLDDQRAVDRAYDVIRREILQGELPPDAHLREEHLALLTNTSRTPVREALRRLAADGLVHVAANRRSYVRRYDESEIDSLFEVRARLESFAAELACRHITADEIQTLVSLADRIDRLGTAISSSDLNAFMDLNTAFHRTIVQASRSTALLVAVTPSISVPVVLLKHFHWRKPVNLVQSNKQHRDIIAALRQRNAPWASACMAAHINSTRPLLSAGPESAPTE
jgi:DNA-binding GntR family transcriptional regulator